MPKARVDRDLLLKIARNARLELTNLEIELFLPQLQEILDAFSKLDELEVSKEKPSFQPIEQKNMLRDDKVGKCLSQQQALSNTQHKEKGYFKGPRIV